MIGETKIVPLAERDWRERAIDEALQVKSRYGEPDQALLRHIRLNRPDWAVLNIYPDRLQMMRFLEENTAGMRSLIAQGNEYENDDEIYRPYVGWFAVEWEGTVVEVVLVPDFGFTEHICFCPDRALLHRFAARLAQFAIRPAGRCLRYSEGWQSAPELDAEIGKVTWDDVVLAPETMASVRESVEGFGRHRDAFRALGFSWRRGILLIGPPGTGKTMVCKAAAAALPDLPLLYVRDLRDEDKKEAIQAIFRRARKVAPCILALEDMDGMIHEQNRSIFLNELDGFQSNEGLLIIATSNHPGKIDEALLKRPSRFDRVIPIGVPAFAERQEYCRRILSRSTLAERLAPGLDIEALASQVAERSEKFTPAYLKEAFISAALQQAQNGADVLDQRFAQAVLAQIDELRHHLRRMRDPEALAEMSHNGSLIGLRR